MRTASFSIFSSEIFCIATLKVMAAFYSTMQTIQSSTIDERKYDIISMLPVEISTSILGLLDPESMQSAMRVCKTWCRLYRGDPRLRRALRQKVRERRQQRMLLIHNESVRPTDSWYRVTLPVDCARKLRTPAKRPKTKKKSMTGQYSCRAKPMRF